MSEYFTNIVKYSGYIILAINTFLYFKSNRKNSIAFKILSYYLLLCLFIQLYTSYLSSLKTNNLYLSHYYFIGQFILLSLFFSKILTGKRLISIIKKILFLVVILLIGYYSLYPKDYLKWNVFEITITSVPLLIYSFIFFTQKIEIKTSNYFIYFNSGFFIYLLSSTLLFTLGNIGIGNIEIKPIKLFVWKVNSILYLIYQILVFVEWNKNFRQKTFRCKTSINT